MSECSGPGCPTCKKPEIPVDAFPELREMVARLYSMRDQVIAEPYRPSETDVKP